MKFVISALFVTILILAMAGSLVGQEGEWPLSPSETAELAAAVKDHPSAALVRQNRWSGSALLSGYGTNPETGEFGAIFKTNAHVTGDPRRDDTMDVIVRLPSGSDRAFTAKTIKYAYSRRGTTDWAFIHAAGLQPDSGLLPVAIWIDGIEEGDAMQFTGFAEGKWYPAANRTVDIVITGRAAPNVPTWDTPTIGGQSGSGVRMEIDVPAKPYSPDWSFDPHWADGVTLTWEWNGKGAGQDNNSIWENIKNRNNIGPDRPPGLIEVQNMAKDHFDGYWECKTNKDREVDVAVQDFPVWYRASDDPIDPVDPPKGLTEEEFDAALRLKALGISLEAMADFQEAIHTPNRARAPPTMQPEPVLEPPKETRWTAPVEWTEGMIHSGKVALRASWDGKDIFVWVKNEKRIGGQKYNGRTLMDLGNGEYRWMENVYDPGMTFT